MNYYNNNFEKIIVLILILGTQKWLVSKVRVESGLEWLKLDSFQLKVLHKAMIQ